MNSPREHEALRAGALASLILLAAAGVDLSAQPVEKPSVDGVRNFARVDQTVATGGATTPAAMPALAAQGYTTVINLRRASEAGADLDASRVAAEAAGLRYVSLPFDGKNPDGATIEAFLRLVQDPANQPTFIHCSSGNRVGALWLVKRVVIDAWPVEKAAAEARGIGLSDQVLEAYVTTYAEVRAR